jgi:hypothetical protein
MSLIKSNGLLIDILADAIPKISIDLVDMIARYYDILPSLDSIRRVSYFPVEVCTMCNSVDPLKIHFAGTHWQRRVYRFGFYSDDPCPALATCCCCKTTPWVIDHQDELYWKPEFHLIVQSSEPFIVNPDETLRLSSPGSKPIVSVCSICTDCLSKTTLSADSQHVLSMSHFNYVISNHTACNRAFIFCPYWLTKVAPTRCKQVPELVAQALLNAPPVNDCIRKEGKFLTPDPVDLLNKFAKAHLNKLFENVLICQSCKKPRDCCGVCNYNCGSGYSTFSNLHICTLPSCWGLFSTFKPDVEKLDIFCKESDMCKYDNVMNIC